MRTLIVEDHLMFREAIRRVCGRDLGLEIVAEASSGEEAIELFQRKKPELILLDLFLPGQSGFAVAARLSEETPTPLLVIISSRCNEFAVQQLAQSQIRGFIDKNSSSLDSIKAAIQAIQKGGTYFCDTYIKLKINLLAHPSAISTMLSDRELEMLPFIAEGLDDLEISGRFEIAQNTVKKHRINILAKFNQESTPKLMAHLNRIGFASTPSQAAPQPAHRLP